MWRYVCFMLALFSLNISAFAQTDTEILPFFYAYWYGPGDLDFHVVDALTGEVLHSFESEGVDCPISLSEDGEWLVYNVADENLLQNLSTGEIFELDSGFIQDVLWNLDDDLVAFLYSHEASEYGLQTYELSSNSQLLNTVIYESYFSSLAVAFDGTDILYASLGYYDTDIEFHRLSVDYDELLNLPISSHEDWWGLRFSPDSRYLLGIGTNSSINLMTLADGTRSSLGETLTVNGIDWMPNEDATVAYLAYDETDSIQIENYTVDSPETEGIDTGGIEAQDLFYFSLSPDGSFAVYALQVEEFEYEWAVINTSNDETQVFASSLDEINWISGSQFVYNGFNTENESIDLYFYDAITGENLQLTDSADRYEIFNCIEG